VAEPASLEGISDRDGEHKNPWDGHAARSASAALSLAKPGYHYARYSSNSGKLRTMRSGRTGEPGGRPTP
jgi:hypothetical protein